MSAKYDQGYEDALEDRKPRSSDAWYMRGYVDGKEYCADLDTEMAEIQTEWNMK